MGCSGLVASGCHRVVTTVPRDHRELIEEGGV